jgi:hypothetical protein
MRTQETNANPVLVPGNIAEVVSVSGERESKESLRSTA